MAFGILAIEYVAIYHINLVKFMEKVFTGCHGKLLFHNILLMAQFGFFIVVLNILNGLLFPVLNNIWSCFQTKSTYRETITKSVRALALSDFVISSNLMEQTKLDVKFEFFVTGSPLLLFSIAIKGY